MVQCSPPSKLFDALGDPNRMEIMELLSDRDHAITELGRHLQISLPATLKHLRILQDAGLATTEKIGRERICRANLSPLDDVIDWTNHVRNTWNARIDSLERFLEGQP